MPVKMKLVKKVMVRKAGQEDVAAAPALASQRATGEISADFLSFLIREDSTSGGMKRRPNRIITLGQ